jgi:hypothetical protein
MIFFSTKHAMHAHAVPSCLNTRAAPGKDTAVNSDPHHVHHSGVGVLARSTLTMDKDHPSNARPSNAELGTGSSNGWIIKNFNYGRSVLSAQRARAHTHTHAHTRTHTRTHTHTLTQRLTSSPFSTHFYLSTVASTGRTRPFQITWREPTYLSPTQRATALCMFFTPFLVSRFLPPATHKDQSLMAAKSAHFTLLWTWLLFVLQVFHCCGQA